MKAPIVIFSAMMFCIVAAVRGQTRSHYDKATDQTTVSFSWIHNVAILGPEKEFSLSYMFSGRRRAAVPDTLLLVITVRPTATTKGTLLEGPPPCT